MPSFATIFCRLQLIFPLAALLLCPCPALSQSAAGQAATYLGPDSDGRQLFKIEAPLTASLTPGDRLGPCKVGKKGLECPPSKQEAAGQSEISPDERTCGDRLQQQKEQYERRYLHSLKEYGENLRRKNYELVEMNRRLQELRSRINREGEAEREDGLPQTGTPLPAGE